MRRVSLFAAAETENPTLDRIGLVIGLVPFVENLGLFFNISIRRAIEKNEIT